MPERSFPTAFFAGSIDPLSEMYAPSVRNPSWGVNSGTDTSSELYPAVNHSSGWLSVGSESVAKPPFQCQINKIQKLFCKFRAPSVVNMRRSPQCPICFSCLINSVCPPVVLCSTEECRSIVQPNWVSSMNAPPWRWDMTVQSADWKVIAGPPLGMLLAMSRKRIFQRSGPVVEPCPGL